MPSFSKTSLERLATCHPDLQRVLHEAIKRVDFAVLCGHRDAKSQALAFHAGVSKVRWPDSRHNKVPSEAVDICPWPLSWTHLKGFQDLAVVVLEVADELGVELAWGGHWQKFKDYPHFELKKKSQGD